MLDRRAWLPIITDALPDRQREVMTALYFEGLSEREVASRLGLHQTTVQEHRDRALVRMESYYTALQEFFDAQG